MYSNFFILHPKKVSWAFHFSFIIHCKKCISVNTLNSPYIRVPISFVRQQSHFHSNLLQWVFLLKSYDENSLPSRQRDGATLVTRWLEKVEFAICCTSTKSRREYTTLVTTIWKPITSYLQPLSTMPTGCILASLLLYTYSVAIFYHAASSFNLVTNELIAVTTLIR